MAGTRLLIVVSFIFPLLLYVIAICIGIGLGSQDLLLIRLRHVWRRSIRRFVSDPLVSAPLDAHRATLVLLVSKDMLSFWQSSLEQFSLEENDSIVVIDHPDIIQHCDQPDQAPFSHSDYSMWLCDHSQHCDGSDVRNIPEAGSFTYIWICEDGKPRANPRMRIQSNHTVLLYPSLDTHAIHTLQHIYPLRTTSPHPLNKIHVRLLFDRSVVAQWKDYMFRVQEELIFMEKQWRENDRSLHLSNLCFMSMELDPAPGFYLSSPSIRNASHEFCSISDACLQASSTSKHRRVHFYVSSSPTVFYDHGDIDRTNVTSRYASLGNDNYMMILQTLDDIPSSLQWIQNEFLKHCLCIPSDHPYYHIWDDPSRSNANETSMIQSSIDFWSFYERIFYIQTIWSRYSSILASIYRMRAILQNNGHRWSFVSVEAIPMVDIDHFKSVVLSSMREERYFDVLSALHFMESQLEQWFQRNQPVASLITDFPLEQYAAILGPILLPLFMPLLTTCVREYIRYRKMVHKA